MKIQIKSVFILNIIFSASMLLLGVVTSNGESTIPPVPDPNKTLPANDGEADGCDSSRFKCVMGGEAVLDKQTGLTWTRNVQIAGKLLPWQDVVLFCQNLEINNQKAWRLSTKDELISILDTSQSGPSLPEGHPFKNWGRSGQNDYWTSTDFEGDADKAWIVSLGNGMVMEDLKIFDMYAWPVRSN